MALILTCQNQFCCETKLVYLQSSYSCTKDKQVWSVIVCVFYMMLASQKHTPVHNV